MTEARQEQEITPSPARPKPWLAVLFSVTCSGLGLLYCGKTLLALASLILTLASLVLAYVIIIWGPTWLLSIWVPWILVVVVLLFNAVWTWRVARHHDLKYEAKTMRQWLKYIALQAVAVGSIYSVLWLLGQPKIFKVPSAAMEDTLYVGDYFVASMSAYDVKPPERGDLIIFLWPGDGVTKYIKRCVALPGDIVEVRDTILFVNGVAQPNPPTVKFIDRTGHSNKNARIPTVTGQNQRDYFGPYVVPNDCYFMLGDNRDNSSDSRVWGPVRSVLLLGKALRVVASENSGQIGARLY